MKLKAGAKDVKHGWMAMPGSRVSNKPSLRRLDDNPELDEPQSTYKTRK
jgi:hypothetical protein